MKYLSALAGLCCLLLQAYSQQPKLILPIGHVSAVVSAEYSKDGKKILTVSRDGTIKIWEDESGKLLLNFADNANYSSGGLTNASFSPDSKLIVTASIKGDASVWDAGSGDFKYKLQGNGTGLTEAVFSPDGKMIATACFDDTVRIWDANTKTITAVLYDKYDNGQDQRTGGAAYIYFCPDSLAHKIVTSFAEHRVVMWDLDTIYNPYYVKIKFHAFNHLNNDSGEEGVIRFTNDGKKILIAADSTVAVRDVSSGKILVVLNSNSAFKSAEFSPDGKKMVTARFWSDDSSIKTWNAETGRILKTVKFKDDVSSARFSPDSSKILVTFLDSADILDAKTYKVLKVLLFNQHDSQNEPFFSPNSKTVVTAFTYNSLACWDATSGSLVHTLSGHTSQISSITYDKTSNNVVSANANGLIKIWDVAEGKPVLNIKTGPANTYEGGNEALVSMAPGGQRLIFHDHYEDRFDLYNAVNGEKVASIEKANEFKFSSDGKKIFTRHIISKRIEGNPQQLIDAENGTIIKTFTGIIQFAFSAASDKMLTYSYKNVSVWDAATGKNISTLKDTINTGSDVITANLQNQFIFSHDGNKIIGWGNDIKGLKVYDVFTGNLLQNIPGQNFLEGETDSAGKKLITLSSDSLALVWSLETGKNLFTIMQPAMATCPRFSPDGKMIIVVLRGNNLQTLDAETGRLVVPTFAQANGMDVNNAVFLHDSKRIVILNKNKTAAKVWDAYTGELLFVIDLPYFLQADNSISNDNLMIDVEHDRLYTTHRGEIKLYNLNTGVCQYSFCGLDSTDYLVYDSAGHYDGTRYARKLVYYTCGGEIVDLDQVKDMAWQPGLAARIMHDDAPGLPDLSTLNICGFAPKVENVSTNGDYRFIILPGTGGLGETVVYVNNIEVKHYKPGELFYANNAYTLDIKPQTLAEYFIPGKNNAVSIKCYTAQNSTISSRNLTQMVSVNNTATNVVRPNLYAVIIGVDVYKDDALKLNYAAKDATDIGSAIYSSATKLFNTDGRQHVFMYNLISNAGTGVTPEKQNIQKTLRAIGKKANINDILLIFFAGHGMVYGESGKQFYLLTADASVSTALNSPGAVGISMHELSEWIGPDSIKAQKRILIMDACGSGEGVNELVKMANGAQSYSVTRGTDNAEEMKAIEKLNERSGIFIIAASASDEKAHELPRYSHGLLTYALLKSIKEKPYILENGKLNISRWFDDAENTVDDLAAQNQLERQRPQVVTTDNINVGIVDNDVIASIKLGDTKPLFGRSFFWNSNIKIDNLNLQALTNKELNNLSVKPGGDRIIYSSEYDGPDKYSLTGDYVLQGDNITINVILVKGNITKVDSYAVNGKLGQLQQLAHDIVARAVRLVGKE